MLKTIIASFVTAIVVAGGAGAYISVVTPAQFAALKSRVSVLQGQVTSLEEYKILHQAGVNDINDLITKTDCLAGDVNSLDTTTANGNEYVS